MRIKGLGNLFKADNRFFDDYKLHDSYLVVDGRPLYIKLCNKYCENMGISNIFGGDNDKLSEIFSTFFDELIICNIQPIVIFDGGLEKKDLKFALEELKENVKTYSMANPENQDQQKYRVYPTMYKDLFKSVLRKKKIQYGLFYSKANSEMASLAKFLNCPVLSNKPEFFLFDVKYLPLEEFFSSNINKKILVKPCKVFQQDHIFRVYPNFEKNSLPMLAILLGDNKNVKKFLPEYFIDNLEKGFLKELKSKPPQSRFRVSLNFLSNHQTLQNAIENLLPESRNDDWSSIKSVLEANIIKRYLATSSTMANVLGLKKDCSFKENFKLEIENNEIILPLWFIEEFLKGFHPSYFIGMIVQQIYLCPVKMESIQHESCTKISFKIINLIFELLLKECDNLPENNKTLKCYVRVNNDVEEIITNINFSLPVFKMRESKYKEERKKIFDQCLNLPSELIIKLSREVPTNMQLYVAIINYWIIEAETIFINNCHLYAILCSMLYHVIDKEIGFYRTKESFDDMYRQDVKKLNENKRDETIPSKFVTINDAYYKVCKEDCILAAPFFMEYFETDKDLSENPQKFDIQIVHSFSLLQNCIMHSTHLNALLDNPYVGVDIENFINCTLLYNLYNAFKNESNLDDYINSIFKYSPTLLHYQ